LKIIFSRKGFDSKNGRVASPIFPDGGLCSLPIPDKWDQKHPPAPRYRVRYKDLRYGKKDLGSVVEDLSFRSRKGTPGVKGTDCCHLDPDLIKGDLIRKAGWLPMFGQANGAAKHLLDQGVREGDLFLFFGWFRRVKDVKGHLRFDPGAQDAHVIFGWLQVGEIWCQFHSAYVPKWGRNHPHLRDDIEEVYNLNKPVDAVFTAKRRLELPGIRRRLPGGGVFRDYHQDLCLTEAGELRTHWLLPSWIYPFPAKKPLSYHWDRRKWTRGRATCHLVSVDIGQEFILDLDSPGHPEKYPADEAYKWLAQIFSHAR
jgi:Nucleotide modification associated domain 3